MHAYTNQRSAHAGGPAAETQDCLRSAFQKSTGSLMPTKPIKGQCISRSCRPCNDFERRHDWMTVHDCIPLGELAYFHGCCLTPSTAIMARAIFLRLALLLLQAAPQRPS